MHMVAEANKCETAYKELKHKSFIQKFIERIWNESRFEELPEFLHDQFVDYSIPVKSLQNHIGLKLYLRKLSESVSHHTEIDEYSEYDDLVICHITLKWNSGNQNGVLSGRRIFRIKEGKILHHWECFVQ